MAIEVDADGSCVIDISPRSGRQVTPLTVRVARKQSVSVEVRNGFQLCWFQATLRRPPPSIRTAPIFSRNINRLNLDVETIVPIHYPPDGRKVTMAELMRAVHKGS